MQRAVLALLCVVVNAAGLAAALAHAAPGASVAWLRDDVVQQRALGTAANGADARHAVAPLGSLWKLLVYTYAVDRNIALPAYSCKGGMHAKAEADCCTPGNTIERDAALKQSCAAFFDPVRLGIRSADWRAYWQQTAPEAAWIADLGQVRASTSVRIDALLRLLGAVPAAPRQAASDALLGVVLDGRGPGAPSTTRAFGGSLRVKTYTWNDPHAPHQLIGGGAGWLSDGTPVWFGAPGSSSAVLTRHAAQIASILPAALETAIDECVAVDFFSRYPLLRVIAARSGEAAPAGPLHGEYRAEFTRLTAVNFRARGDVTLDFSSGEPKLAGRFTLTQYVARVIDREGVAGETEAAKALAVAARTYLLQNGQRHQPHAGGCYATADSGRLQRVSINPPSPEALRIAGWVSGLVLTGAPVQYHLDKSGANRMAWTEAVASSRQGEAFDTILARAYPKAVLGAQNAASACTPHLAAAQWLRAQQPRWRRVLAQMPGFEVPTGPIAVCTLGYGNPYSDQARNRIYVRGLVTLEDRITLAHEYLHLALKGHPAGQNEALVEQLARKLADAV